MIFGKISVQWGVVHHWLTSDYTSSLAWWDEIIACNANNDENEELIRLWNSTDGLINILMHACFAFS